MTARTEEEELAQIKEWWKRNGKPLLTGGVLALAVVFGWQAWQRYRTSQAQDASMVYQQLTKFSLAPKPDAAKVAELNQQLQSSHAGTHYAQYGSLLVAKVAVESGRLEDAASELQAIIEKPVDETLGELARERLARVKAAQGKVEEGLKLLDGKVDPAFLAIREEVRGDLLVQLGNTDGARAAYESAKAALSDEAAIGTLQMKLDDLAKGDA